MRTVIVGEAPIASTVGLEALGPEGASGRHLASLLGVERASSVARTVNLFDHVVETWCAPAARDRAEHLLAHFTARRWILCGRRVAAAFGVDAADWMTWQPLATDRLVAVLPHPSGLNHWWNEEANVVLASDFLQWAVRDESWVSF